MASINGFELDATLIQQHSLNNRVSANPVEKGADITDHIQPLPAVITLECVVSNTPIGPIAASRLPGSAPSDDAYAMLVAIRKAQEPVTIETELGFWENMALRDLGLPFSADEGTGIYQKGTDEARLTGALKFRVTFHQIELVSNKRTTVNVDVPRAQNKVNRGNKPSKEAGKDGVPNPSKDAVAYRSTLDRLLF